MHPELIRVTERIVGASAPTRRRYLADLARAGTSGPRRSRLGCGNLAHGFAACAARDKLALAGSAAVNVGIVTAYNDVLSAHQPYAGYPELLKRSLAEVGAVGQVAGGVPAMCDGITQGREGMELSLFSRDVIAMSTAVALSHDLFDAVLCLGVCDKIVPGLLIGALRFGHLPAVFVPAGPMPTGVDNGEKAKVRERHAAGDATREQLLDVEARSYHAPGTCTFYGTANSNQLLLEVMGLHLPGAAFVPPGTAARDAFTAAAARRAAAITALGSEYTPIGHVVDERAVVNAMVALLATGGSTNHTLHLVAIARAAGIRIDWDDFAALARVTPLVARIYPNGAADVNQFHRAGGTAFVVHELLGAGLLHPDVRTVVGEGLEAYAREVRLEDDALCAADGPPVGRDPGVVRPAADPFEPDGGLRLLTGRLGRAVIKVSSVAAQHRTIEAPAAVFDDPHAFLSAFRAGALDRDVVVVVRFQGPRANGMPELHDLTPALGVLQARGRRVALVTDGRMSGASGRVPAAIHVTPEAACGGALARLRDGDLVRLDAVAGRLEVDVDEAEWAARPVAIAPASGSGFGRELFGALRGAVASAEQGAHTFGSAFDGGGS